MFKRLLVASISLLTLFNLNGCGDSGGGGAASSDKPSVAFVTNCVADFWTIAKVGAEKAAADFDVTVDVRMPVDPAADQKRILEDILIRGVDGIAISPADPANQTALLNDACSNQSDYARFRCARYQPPRLCGDG